MKVMVTIHDHSIATLIELLYSSKKVSKHLFDKNIIEKLHTFSSEDQQSKRQVSVDLISILVPRAIAIMFKIKKEEKTLIHNKIKDYVSAYKDFEDIIYVTHKGDLGYRDHLEHAIRDFCIGIIVLHNTKLNKEIDQSKISEFEAAWCLTALFHDFGYPLQKTKKIALTIKKMIGHVKGTDIAFGEIIFDSASTIQISKYLEEISRYDMFILHEELEKLKKQKILEPYKKILEAKLLPLFSTITSNIVIPTSMIPTTTKKQDPEKSLQKIISYSLGYDPKIYFLILDNLRNYHHGVLSSIILLQMLESHIIPRFDRLRKIYEIITNEKWSELNKLYNVDLVYEVAHAIALHNLPLNEGYLKFKERPLSYLLAFCDEIQDWDRPVGQEMFAQSRTWIKSIQLDVTDTKVTAVFDFSKYSDGLGPDFNEIEFYKGKLKSIQRLYNDKIQINLKIIPRKHVGKKPLVISTCNDCHIVFGSHELKNKKLNPMDHQCPQKKN